MFPCCRRCPSDVHGAARPAASSIYFAFKISLTPLPFLVKQFPIKKSAGVLENFSEGSVAGQSIINTLRYFSVPALLIRRAGVAEDALEALDILRLADRFRQVIAQLHGGVAAGFHHLYHQRQRPES